MSDAPSTDAQPTPQPTRTIAQANAAIAPSGGNNKTISVAIAGSICTIAAWVVQTKFGLDVPADVQSAVQNLITIITVYMVPHSNASGQAN